MGGADAGARPVVCGLDRLGLIADEELPWAFCKNIARHRALLTMLPAGTLPARTD